MYKLVKDILKKHQKALILVFSVQIFSSAMSMILPFLNGKFVDLLVYATEFEQIKKFILILLGITGLNVALAYCYKIIVLKTKNKMSFALNIKMIEHLQKIPIELYEKYDPTYLNQRIKGDCEVVINFWLDNTVTIILNLFAIFFVFTILYSSNHILFVIAIAFIPLYCIIYFFMKKPLYERNINAVENSNLYFGHMNDIYLRNREIKVKCEFEKEKAKLRKSFEQFFCASLKYSKMLYRLSASDNIVAVLFQSVLFIVGGQQVITKNMTIGQFSVMNTYFNMVLNLVKYYFGIGQTYQTVKISKQRLCELMRIKEEVNGIKDIKTICKIYVSNFNYKFNDKEVYRRKINFVIEKAGIYSILGKNGTGKTTLINALIGIYNYAYVGEVSINDINIKDINLYSLRKKMLSVMLQEEKLPSINTRQFVFENISTKAYDEALVDNRYEHVFFSDIFNIKNIFNRNVLELSSGEKQMLLLFVTLLKEADLFVLDEPTSNLYSELVDEVFELIRQKSDEGKIVIIISHDKRVASISQPIYEILP